VPGVESALSSFLDSLDEEERGQQALVSTCCLSRCLHVRGTDVYQDDGIDYPSLDAENNDEEESHYLGQSSLYYTNGKPY
jgi:hypothetical protein